MNNISRDLVIIASRMTKSNPASMMLMDTPYPIILLSFFNWMWRLLYITFIINKTNIAKGLSKILEWALNLGPIHNRVNRSWVLMCVWMYPTSQIHIWYQSKDDRKSSSWSIKIKAVFHYFLRHSMPMHWFGKRKKDPTDPFSTWLTGISTWVFGRVDWNFH